MTRWRAEIEISLHDEGAEELHAMMGTEPVASPHGTVTLRLHADSIEEACVKALAQAVDLLERRP